jgi:predicted Rossmann-fold nucleotide-binding protein
MTVTLPRHERFLNPAPQRAEQRHLQTLKECGQRNASLALDIQLNTHQLLANPDYYRVLRRWPRINVQRIRGMAFESYYPLESDLEALERSLKGKKGPVHEAVWNYTEEMRMLIQGEEEYWQSTRWTGEARTMHQNTEAVDKITNKLSGRLAFFGSARLEEGSPEYEAARWLSGALVEHLGKEDGTSEEVVTGGGPGIMEAGNRGALEGSWAHLKHLESLEKDPKEIHNVMLTHRSRLQSIGVRIELPFETGWNKHLQANLTLPNFPARKEALITLVSGRYGPNRELPDYEGRHPAFFVMKGGIGTKDELWEVICLIQCGKIPPLPVIVIGDPERRSIEVSMNIMEKHGTISPQDVELKAGDHTCLLYCKNEHEAALKYLEWYKINPPEELLEEIKKRTPAIHSKEQGENTPDLRVHTA